MRIVLDTNVVVSAMLTPGGPSHQVIQMVFRGDLQPCVDGRMLAEYREVLTRGKFRLSVQVVEEFLTALLMDAQEVLPAPVSGRFPDESDRAFVEVGISGQADALVTWNLRHFRVAESLGIRVKTPRDFLAWLRR